MKGQNVFAICCFLLAVKVGNAKKGFIFTSPKVLEGGSKEYLTLSVFDVPPNEEVTVSLLRSGDKNVLAESKVDVLPNQNMWVEMFVPPTTNVMRAKINIFGKFSDGYKIEEERNVIIRPKADFTLIQTDKPLYKPGQTVKFRVLPMDGALRPLGKNAAGDIWIEDPKGIRVAQWKDLKFETSMIQMELPLSEEPTFGIWSIKSLINNLTSVQEFKVEKYVLPKFKVDLISPPYIMNNEGTFFIQICAWYTYGKRVDGKWSASIVPMKGQKSFTAIEKTGEISGCQAVIIDTKDLSFGSTGAEALKIFAEVVEKGTEILVNQTTEIQIVQKPLQLKFLNSVNGKGYIKPRIPYSGRMSVKRLNGMAASTVNVSICVNTNSRECRTFASDENGLIRFTLHPRKEILQPITFEAEVVDPLLAQKMKARLILFPWYSPSASYLQIEPITEQLACEKNQSITIRYTAKKGDPIQFHYQVISRGRIVEQSFDNETFYMKDDKSEGDNNGWFSEAGNGDSTLPSSVGEYILSFTPKATMSPVARLLVFFVLKNGEIVADSKVFRVQKCFMNKVRLSFHHKQQYPNTEATILLSASPFSVCGIRLGDQSVQILSKDTQFSEEKLFNWMESQDVDSDAEPHRARKKECNSFTYTDQDYKRIKRRSFHWESYEDTLDTSSDSFDWFELQREFSVLYPSGFWPRHRGLSYRYLRDYYSRPYFIDYRDKKEKHADSVDAFENAGMVVMTDLTLETRHCTVKRIPYRRRNPHFRYFMYFDEPGARFFSSSKRKDYFMRPSSLMPEETVDEVDVKNEVDLTKFLEEVDSPKLIPKSTEEIRNYFPETWLWEMHTIESSGDKTLKRQLPHTITEWIGEAVCFNSEAGIGISEKSSITAYQPFFLSVQLPYSVIRSEMVPIIVSVFNYLEECLPIKISLEPSEDYKIINGSSSHKMCVCGDKSETHRFIIRPITLGQVNITVYAFSVNSDEEICGNEVISEVSARDAITKQLLIEAEGFPKEEVLNYFICPEATNGTYFSEVDLLLPENVVDGSARAYISVSSDLMAQALNGLQNLVKLPSGCGEQNMILFVPNIFVLDYLSATGKVTVELKEECINNMRKGYQRELQYRHNDGSYSAFGKSDREGSLWLTAFVLKSFGQARRFMDIDENDLLVSSQWILNRQLENGCFEPSGRVFHKDMKGGLNDGKQSLAPLTAYILISLLESRADSLNQTVAKNALKCLEEDENPSNYALALFAYATALSKEVQIAKEHLKLLDERAIIKGNLKYWETSHKSKSVSVEIAGYYVLALLEVNEQDGIFRSAPVVKWIAQQRNSNGGFVSTQQRFKEIHDTVVALQALAKYSALTSQVPVDISLVVKTDELVREFKLDESNRLVTQREKIPVLPAVAELLVVGDGCAIVQFSLRYNVKTVLGSEAFDLDVDVICEEIYSCNSPSINICMRYKDTDEASNMVVVEIKMASGFVPLESSLDLLKSNQSIRLKRYDVEDNLVNFYFNELTNESKCFNFNLKKEIDVQDVKPATVKLYDYYQPELEVAKEYVIRSAYDATDFVKLKEELNNLTVSGFLSTSDDLDEFWSTQNITSLTSESLRNVTNVSIKSTVIRNPFPQNKGVPVHLADLDSFSLPDFVDSIDDPGFPVGTERNSSLSILTPVQDFSKLNDKTILDCPICMDTFPVNFTDTYCSSAFALRASVRSGNPNEVKILQDISFYNQHPQLIEKLAEVQWDERCSCQQLTEGENTVIITGSPITLWSSEDTKHRIHLTKRVQVVSSSAEIVQPEELKEARKSCHRNP